MDTIFCRVCCIFCQCGRQLRRPAGTAPRPCGTANTQVAVHTIHFLPRLPLSPPPPQPLTSQLRERAPTLTDSRRAGEEWAGPTWPAPTDEPSLPYADFLKAPAPLPPRSRFPAPQGVTRQCGRDARQALRAGEVVVVDFVGKNGDKVRDRCGCGCCCGYCCYCCFCCCGFF